MYDSGSPACPEAWGGEAGQAVGRACVEGHHHGDAFRVGGGQHGTQWPTFGDAEERGADLDLPRVGAPQRFLRGGAVTTQLARRARSSTFCGSNARAPSAARRTCPGRGGTRCRRLAARVAAWLPKCNVGVPPVTADSRIAKTGRVEVIW